MGMACGEADPAMGSGLDVELAVAWVGEGDEGFRVVAEPLLQHPFGPELGLSEERMIRQQLGIAPELRLMRLHLIGSLPQVEESGQLEARDGPAFESLGPPPAHLSARGRNLWLGLGGAGTVRAVDSGLPQRRTFLLGGRSKADREGEMRWQRNDESLTLQPRTWTLGQRQEFLSPLRLPPQDG